MAFWIFQILIDVGTAALALLWIDSRRRIDFLEYEITELKKLNHMGPAMSEDFAQEPRIETSLGASISTLSEKSWNESEKPSFDAYEKAAWLLSKDTNLKEVAKQTGLSLSELHLLGKMAQRNQ